MPGAAGLYRLAGRRTGPTREGRAKARQGLLVLLAAGLCACGGASAEPPMEPAGVGRSAVVLTKIPPVRITKQLFGRTTVRIAPPNQDARFFYGGKESRVEFPNGAILAARAREVGGVLHVLLSVVDRTTERCTIYRVHDANRDGLPDPSTAVAVGDSGSEKAYVTYISAARNGVLHLLDRRCQDVFTLVDTDADGWEDEWQSFPMVRSADFPYLLHARAVYGGDGDAPTVRVYPQEDPLAVQLRIPIEYREFREYSDLNHDGRAEAEATWDLKGAPPCFEDPPQAGAMRLRVDCTRGGGSVNDIVEAWRVDASGAELALLGTAVLEASLVGEIPLITALASGERMALKRRGASARFGILVWPDGPTILRAEPTRLVEGEATTVEIQGRRFSAASRAWLRAGRRAPLALSTTHVTTHRLHVMIPAQSLNPGALVYLYVQDQDVDSEPRAAPVNYFPLVVHPKE